MLSLNANEAKTKLGYRSITAQSEPVKIINNGTQVAFVVSSKEYSRMEEIKLELVKTRFSNTDDDLIDGDTFFDKLDSGKYD